MSNSNKPSCFSTKIDVKLKGVLKAELENRSFTLTHPPHTIFSAKKKGVSCTLYESGALTVQGKDKDEFIEFFLEPEILKDTSYTYPHLNVDFKSHIGVDEAGKGDFFGPLCIAALYADEKGIEKLLSLGIKDSKKIADKKILELAKKIKRDFQYSMVVIFPEKYNELYARFRNLNSLLAWAHATAIVETVEKSSCKTVLIDQFAHESVVKKAVAAKKVEIDLSQRHKGEEDPIVAGASILARAAFLDGMDALSKKIEFELPKGASKAVVAAGKKLVAQHGAEILGKIGKMHFKTKNEILNS